MAKWCTAAWKRVSSSGCLTLITAETRRGCRRATRTSSHSISDCKTDSQLLDVADTNTYKLQSICQFCNKESSRPSNLARHVKNNCLQNPAAMCNTSKILPFVCKKCGRRFKLRKSLTYHERHECQRFVFCPDCNKKLKGAIVPSQHITWCKRKKQKTKGENLTDVLLPVKDEDLHSELILFTSADSSC